MKNVGSRRGRGEREVNRALEGFARVTMSRYLRRGNVIEEENVGFYSDWSEKRDGRTAAVETSYGGTNGASLVQWRNVSFVYIYVSRIGGVHESTSCFTTRSLLEIPIRRREAPMLVKFWREHVAPLTSPIFFIDAVFKNAMNNGIRAEFFGSDRDIRSQLIEIVYLHTDDFQIFHQISSYINLFRSVKKYWLRWRDAKATIDLLKRFSPVFLPGISVQETNLKASRLE